MKLHNISVTPKFVKKVITNLIHQKHQVLIVNSESDLSYILAEHFNTCLKESCFSDCWKVSLLVPLFKDVQERSTDKTNTLLVFSLWLVKP